MDDVRHVSSINYLALVLRRWKIVLASTLACAIAGTILYLLLPKSYDSSVMLLVYPPSFKNPVSVSTKQDSPADKTMLPSAEGISELMAQTLPMETYRNIATSRDLLQGVRTKLQLEDYAIEDIEDRCRVDLTPLGSRSPQFGTQYSQTIEFHTTWSSPEVAAEMAQAWAEIFKERVDKLSEEGLTQTHGLIESMWSGTKDELQKNEEALQEFDATWDLELMAARRKARELDLTTLETDLVTIEIDLASQGATLASLEADLAKEEKIDILFRAPSDDVYWQRKSGETKIDSKTGLLTEELNENYLTTRKDVIMAASILRGLEEKKLNTVAKLAEIRGEIDLLDDEIVTRTTEQKRLSRDVATMERSFELAATALQKAKLANVNNASDIRIVGNAVVSGRASNTGGLVQIMMTGLIGCLLGMAYVVVGSIVSKDEAGAADPT